MAAVHRARLSATEFEEAEDNLAQRATVQAASDAVFWPSPASRRR